MSKRSAKKVAVAVADIFEEQIHSERIGRRESQLLLGEIFEVEAIDGRFYKGRSRHDGYRGYVYRHDVDIYPEGNATHFIDNPISIIHKGPDIKTRSVMTVSMMSRVQIEKDSLKNGFLRVCGHGWIPETHVKPLATLKERIDHVEQALRLLSMPYRYGGRSTLGIDCSGFTQITLMRSGYGRIPRDADMQEKSERLGPKVPHHSLKRGDIVFFPQHVGIMIDDENIISATEKYARVIIEPLNEMIERQGAITTVRRPAQAP